MKTLVVAALVSALAVPAFAGGVGGKMAEPVVEPRATETPAPVTPARDWTGPYVGLNGTFIDANVRDAPGNANGFGVGAHLGYTQDFGGFVLGVEGEWDFYNDVEFGSGVLAGDEVESVGRLKARAGVPLGNDLLAYGTAGVAHARTSAGNDEGWLVGAGAEYMITDDFSLGGELLYHRFDDFDDSNIDLEATTVSLRGSFRF